MALWAERSTDLSWQVYRRDMDGGDFAMLNYLSAPIIINGVHLGQFAAGLYILRLFRPQKKRRTSGWDGGAGKAFVVWDPNCPAKGDLG